jgi:hypothetical protein
MLQDLRALYVAIAVQPGRENEVALEQGGVVTKDLEDFIVRHEMCPIFNCRSTIVDCRLSIDDCRLRRFDFRKLQ